jgi:hypothetical protein
MSYEELKALAREQRMTLDQAMIRLHPIPAPTPFDLALLASLKEIREQAENTKRLITCKNLPNVVETVSAFLG